MPPKGTKKVPCPDCKGAGVLPVGDLEEPCDACKGSGSVFQDAQK